ncbi:MAG: hypothetical protein K2N90_05135, partial [Lachnospiraceae bacterium]|nr:hypothetical protein [Lachnospiraceae bacterium]
EEEGWYGKQNWTIYKLTPTAETTVTVKLDALDKYTVTIEKSERIKNYDADSDVNGILTSGITDVSKTFDEIKENTDLTILNIDTIFDEQFDDETGEPPVYIRKVEYKTGDGEFQRATADYFPYEAQYNIKITGDMVIRIDAEPVEEYEVSFEDTVDNYDVKIWETGYGYNEENEDALSRTLSGSDNKITLKNDKEYRFSILPKDGYKTESVVLTKKDGTQLQLEERQDVSDELEDGKSEIYYVIGDGYGNTGDLTIKAALTAAYTLGFDIQASGLKAYSWEEPIRIDNKRIAILPEDSYSFYFRDSDNTFDEERYNITVDDAFTLTRDYRRIRNPEYDEYEDFTVFTIKVKDAAQALKAATVNVTLKPSKQISLVYPNQVKYVGIAYYSGNTQNNYKIINNQANVRGSSNILEVSPVTGYDVTVTMKGALSEAETLSFFRMENGVQHYYLGEITEDKTITVTAQRTVASQKYRIVTFSGRYVSVKDSVNKIPYDIGEYYNDEDIYGGFEYSVLKGSSIFFTAEPYYGYKVESVTAAGEVIEPKEDGSYEFMPRRDDPEGTIVIIRTVKADNPDEPDNPDKPDEPVKKTAAVKVTYLEQVFVAIEGYSLDNNQVTVESGTQLSFKATVTDETYEIKSVTAGGIEIPVDAATGTYTITINADTEIIITAEKKQEEPQPEKKYTVRFTHPQFVSVAVNGLQTDSVNDVAEGTKVSFSVICMDENYQIKSVKANGADVAYDTGAGSYALTVTADTEVVIEAEQKPNVDANAPTAVKVQGVSSKGELNLSQQNRKYTITLTPADADGSVLGVKVNPENSVIKASITSETRGSRIIYYLSLEKPQASVGDTAEITIYNTKTGEAISGGTIKVITRTPSTEEPDTSGLKVTFEGYDETETPSYTYTGSAVTPELEVTYNGEYLEQGTDYTIKYANNINASTNEKPAKLTITGKGSLAGKHDYTFKITPKDIGAYDVKAGSVKVVKGAKATPVLVYNGMVLGKKDFDNPKAAEKFSADSTITLTGKGNYTGTREVKVEAVDKGQLNKISIKLDNAKNKNLAYDGTEKYPAFQVLDAKKTDITNKENEAYIVVYPENVISAGTVKFTVVGIGDYTGTVTKSYKIKPSAKAAGDINVSAPNSAGYTFVSTGVTEYDPDVTLKDGTWLEKGRDYTLAYSNNKKAGTAKCKINFIGNYKGVKAITKEFKINQFNIADFDADNIIAADLTSGGKPGAYKSVPYIIDNEANALIKSSEFKFTYYVDEAMKTEMKEKLTSGKIWVKIEPKNAAKGNYTGTRTVSYTIRESGKDLSKAKITFEPNKPAYTGSEVTPECKVDGTSIKNDPKYQVRYLSNINKGKATVIITGAEGSDYVGSKTATFTIAASDIK